MHAGIKKSLLRLLTVFVLYRYDFVLQGVNQFARNKISVTKSFVYDCMKASPGSFDSTSLPDILLHPAQASVQIVFLIDHAYRQSLTGVKFSRGHFYTRSFVNVFAFVIIRYYVSIEIHSCEYPAFTGIIYSGSSPVYHQ